MQKFPIVTALTRYGGLFAAAVATLTALVGIYLAAVGGGYLWAAGGVLAGSIVYILLKSYAELVAILSDMLMPR